MADQNNPYAGLFSQFGVDSRSPGEILAERKRDRFQQTRANSLAMNPGFRSASENAMFNIGSQAGSAVAQHKWMSDQPQLSDEESKRAEAVQNVNATMKEMIGTPEWEGLDPEGKEELFQSTLAGELSKAGDVATGVNMFSQLAQKRRMREKQKLELKRAGIDTDTAETKKDQAVFDLFQDKSGTHQDIYRPGKLQPEAAYIDPVTREAVLADGERLKDYSYGPDKSLLAGMDGGRKPGAKNQNLTASEQGKIRQQRIAVIKQMKGALRMKNALMDAAKAGDGSINIMGSAGAITQFTGRAVETFSALARTMEHTYRMLGRPLKEWGGIVDGDFAGQDLAKKGTATKYAQDERREIDAAMRNEGVFDLLPENIRNSVQAREQYYAALAQLAYAQAQTQESGARQFSDNDIKMAMASLAGTTGDPEAFRKVMFGNVEDNVSTFMSNLKGLPADVDPYTIIGPAGMEELFNEYDAFQEAFGTDFGSAAEPGPGLVEPPEAVDLGDGFSVTIN